MANKNMIRIRLKAYDHQLIDKAAETIDDLRGHAAAAHFVERAAHPVVMQQARAVGAGEERQRLLKSNGEV